jgi:thiamine kinase-like enzyme
MSIYRTRYFNFIENTSVSGQIRKSSKDVEKLKQEFDYWYMLPDYLQKYFVQPFDFKSDESVASYCMQEVQATDVGHQLVGGLLSGQAFKDLFNELKIFKELLPELKSTEIDVDISAQSLVLGKTLTRVQQLKTTEWYQSRHYRALSESGVTLDSVYLKLEKEFYRLYPRRATKKIIMSHGDLTFSNILWEPAELTFKLIDPKGADHLYMDEYYDLAKLSQSVNGQYDFIVNGLYESDNATCQISFLKSVGQEEKAFFAEYLAAQGVDIPLVRVYEASLFLSMIPMHLDDFNRASAFLINCNQILESV